MDYSQTKTYELYHYRKPVLLGKDRAPQINLAMLKYLVPAYLLSAKVFANDLQSCQTKELDSRRYHREALAQLVLAFTTFTLLP